MARICLLVLPRVNVVVNDLLELLNGHLVLWV